MAVELCGSEGHVEARRAFGHANECHITFREAASRYEGDKRFLPALVGRLGETPIAKIDQALIDRLAAEIYPGASPATWDRQAHGVISAVLKNAGDWRLIKRPRKSKASRLHWISPAESVRLAAHCWPHFRPLYLLMQHTGAQPAEAVFLDWEQVDLARGDVYFPASESADGRHIQLSPLVKAALARLPHRRGAAFRRLDGKPYTRTNRAAAAVKTAFIAACRRAKIRNYTLRDVRVTWGLWHFSVNRDLDSLMIRGGWRDHRTLARYKRVSVAELDALRDAVRALHWDADLAENSWRGRDV